MMKIRLANKKHNLISIECFVINENGRPNDQIRMPKIKQIYSIRKRKCLPTCNKAKIECLFGPFVYAVRIKPIKNKTFSKGIKDILSKKRVKMKQDCSDGYISGRKIPKGKRL